jgi:3-oxoacyl-[acyl-carrier protein] reductase
MELNLDRRVAIVTGASRGIGSVIAAHLEHEGAIVYRLDVAPPATGPAPERFLSADITVPDQVEAATRSVLEREDGIDILVNNAGVNAVGSLDSVDLGVAARCLAVNVTGLLAMCQAVIPAMKRARHGRIINAASFAAIVPAQGNGIYAASKAAVVQLTRVLAGELGPWDITVNAYAPGMIPTAINGFTDLPAAEQDRLLDTLTLRRWGTADEVADLVCFLAGDPASYITGSLIDVSGGKLATQRPALAYESFAAGSGA